MMIKTRSPSVPLLFFRARALRRMSALLGLAACFSFAGAQPLKAQEQDGHVLSFIEENDLYYNPFGEHQDRHYTQGFKLIYLEPGVTPSWWKS